MATPVRFDPPPVTPGDGGPDNPSGPGGRGRTRSLLKILLITTLALTLVAGVAGASVAYWLQGKYDGNIERFGDPFRTIPSASRPKAAPGDAQNILLLGSDSRVSAGDPSEWARGAQRTDAIMIAHIPADRSGAQIVSIPRDSWVDVPDYGKQKVNAAFSYGGPALMVRTVEKLTRVRIDHVVVVDFTGFAAITDALGGVTIDVAQATKDQRGAFAAGRQRMDGATALKYVRQRHNLPGGDFDRVKRHQNWVRAVANETLAKGTLSNPFTVNSVLSALTRSLSTDDGFSVGEMRSLALSMRGARSNDLSFLTAPVKGTGTAGKQSIVLLDPAKDKQLWTAMATDRMAPWLARNQDDLLSDDVR
jgi:LCP family protein required for cell wall assembly